MTEVIPYIGVADLSAYLDGELDEARRQVVERLLAEQPEMVERLSEYRRRDAALRQAFGELFPPDAISTQRQVRWAIGFRGCRTWAAAALCLALFAGGWWVYTDSTTMNRELARVVHDATAAHILYSSHPGSGLGIAKSSTPFSPALTQMLGRDTKSPDLSAFGFHLVGVRKLPDVQRPAVLFAYRNSRGQLISCYFQLVHGSHETRFLRGDEDGFHVSYRLTPQLAYAVVGTLPVEQLQQIADAADAGISDDSEDDRTPGLKTKVMR